MDNANETLKAYNSIYLEIIMRYRDYIEEREGLYLADLPKLVTPEEENVLFLAKQMQSSFPVYSYEENFLEMAKLSYNYIKEKIIQISLPLQFWLRPAQTIKYGAGDLFDKAVLLCSLLIASGNSSAKVIVMANNRDRKFIVFFEFQNKVVGIDIEKGIKEYNSVSEIFEGLDIDKIGEDDEDTTVYEFNDRIYRDIV
jgi:hypothetical protein